MSKRNTKNNSLVDVTYDKVFVACGSIASTALIVRSFSDCSQKIIIKDSQKYLFPFIVSKPIKKSANKTPLRAQLVLQIENLKNTSKVVHIQLYSFNDLMAKPVKRIFRESNYKFSPILFSPY